VVLSVEANDVAEKVDGIRLSRTQVLNFLRFIHEKGVTGVAIPKKEPDRLPVIVDAVDNAFRQERVQVRYATILRPHKGLRRLNAKLTSDLIEVIDSESSLSIAHKSRFLHPSLGCPEESSIVGFIDPGDTGHVAEVVNGIRPTTAE
jgi:hypothetical protein